MHHSTCNIHFFSIACLFRSYQNFRKYFKSLFVHWEQLVLTNSCWTVWCYLWQLNVQRGVWLVLMGTGVLARPASVTDEFSVGTGQMNYSVQQRKVYITQKWQHAYKLDNQIITELCTIFYTLIFFALVIQRCVISCNWMYILFAKGILRTDPLLFNSWVEEERCSL